MSLTMLLVALALVLATWITYAWTRPDQFRVVRHTTITASPEKLFLMISDLRNFNTWNPFLLKDPHVKGTYGGPQHGCGSHYSFVGNREVGAGSVFVMEAEPSSRIAMRLDMVRPFACRNQIEFTLDVLGHGTKVTWAMEGKSPLIGRMLFMSAKIDAMIGRQFEDGLSRLKGIVEVVRK